MHVIHNLNKPPLNIYILHSTKMKRMFNKVLSCRWMLCVNVFWRYTRKPFWLNAAIKWKSYIHSKFNKTLYAKHRRTHTHILTFGNWIYSKQFLSYSFFLVSGLIKMHTRSKNRISFGWNILKFVFSSFSSFHFFFVVTIAQTIMSKAELWWYSMLFCLDAQPFESSFKKFIQ